VTDPGPPPPPSPQAGFATAVAAALVLALAAAAVFAAGLSLGGQGLGRDADEQAAIEAFIETYRRINDEYVGESEPGALLEGAIEGMFETLDDPYSGYLGPDEFEATFAEISGEFEGVGARMDTEDDDGRSCVLIDGDCALRVVEVLPDTPALAAGLQADDVVVAVDGRSLAGQTMEGAVALIRGPRDSRVTLTLRRAGEELRLAITRGVIVSQDVRSALLADGRIGYLRIDGFSSRVADSFEAALREHLDAGVTSLILDVREDPGGFVDAAVEITSQFLPDGPVYWEESADGSQRSIDVQRGGLATDPAIGLVVLVDDGTASASEMMAGALQDAGRAPLVGERTFGKGTVQEWTQLPGDSGGFRLSIAKWLTRDKAWVHGTGLVPDVEVADGGRPPWPGASDDVDDALATDPQLRRAVSLLLGVGVDATGTIDPTGHGGPEPTVTPPAARQP
jgi:carboxyl-terminal processing protease